MKVRFKKEKGNKPTVLEGKGIQYSEVAEEVNRSYEAWLNAAGWTEEQLLVGIDCPLFDLIYDQREDAISVTLENRDGVIGTPICWNEESPLTIGEFKVDCALLLMLIAYKGVKDARRKQIESFIRIYLL